ncbi:YdeI/OmpD-associated family protein [Photobacterium sp. WH77]|uniref:YdeI/OmpD-associated family protein n=1 Tax=unclassified Photobacterium TaxID=2628852 RepID=UPI001EDB468B|nr:MULTISPECIES: YdeI/OmpD-associated family protein [unclassified Photobacterium]MCG2838754.1 YdeI/OmpD-associated family protein [Photobacterium sp. WH77]MCG2846325.1 YdeI/OmpD-associated family protein [Photobacterium sp. WH80]
MPIDLAQALEAASEARATWDETNWICWIVSAKQAKVGNDKDSHVQDKLMTLFFVKCLPKNFTIRDTTRFHLDDNVDLYAK